MGNHGIITYICLKPDKKETSYETIKKIYGTNNNDGDGAVAFADDYA